MCVCKVTGCQSSADLSVNMDIWSASAGRENDDDTERVLGVFASAGRPQRAETSYPPRTCVPFSKLKCLAFLDTSYHRGEQVRGVHSRLCNHEAADGGKQGNGEARLTS